MSDGDPFRPIHPGEVLREDFLAPANISVEALSEAMGIPVTNVRALAEEQAPMTGEMALRLERALGATAQFWMNLQNSYELEVAKDAADRAQLDAIPNINPVLAAE